MVSGGMADPETLDWLPGLVTDTVLVMVQVNEAVPEKPPPSVALTTTEFEPAVVGVPETVPVPELMERPAGSPVADQVRVAPDWLSVAELVSGVMALPEPLAWLPGLATETVLVMVQVNEAVPEKPPP